MKSSARKGRARVAGASGQALVPALIFLLVGSIGLYVAFNSFQMTSAKIKLQNTADAAAYSAAVLQARDYNFSAYLNRAMVANQVTVAQAVALKSWIDDLDNLYGTTSPANAYITQFADHPGKWTAPQALGKIDTAAARATLDTLLPTLVKGIDSITQSMSSLQTNYHNAMFAAVPEVSDTVANKNQADTHVTSGYFTSPRNAAQLLAWKSHTYKVTPAGDTGSDDFADVVTNPNTLDGFVKSRLGTRSTAPNYQQIVDTSWRCPSGGQITATVSHEGGTQLRIDKKGWESIDASTATVKLTCVTTPQVMNVSNAGSANGNIQNFAANPIWPVASDWMGYGGYYNFGNPTGSTPGVGVSAAMAEQMRKGPDGGSMDIVNGGLLPYQNVNGVPRASQAPRITIEVTRDSSTLVKTPGLHGTGAMQIDNNAAGGAMRALSSANAYFVRPDETSLGNSLVGGLLNADKWARADHKTEYPSLFSPYWQAALAPVSENERFAAQANQMSVQR